MPSGDRDDRALSATRGVLSLAIRTGLSKRGPVSAQHQGGKWINQSKEQTKLRIGVTVPTTKKLGVIKATWGQRR
jgi:hypothetical protein